MSSRVLICGSRDWDDIRAIRTAVSELTDVTIIVGGARGADTIAEDAARFCRHEVIRIDADWSKGRGAGPQRNLEMLNLEPDLVIAFWKGTSAGTRHTVRNAMKRGIPTRIEWRP